MDAWRMRERISGSGRTMSKIPKISVTVVLTQFTDTGQKKKSNLTFLKDFSISNKNRRIFITYDRKKKLVHFISEVKGEKGTYCFTVFFVRSNPILPASLPYLPVIRSVNHYPLLSPILWLVRKRHGINGDQTAASSNGQIEEVARFPTFQSELNTACKQGESS